MELTIKIVELNDSSKESSTARFLISEPNDTPFIKGSFYKDKESLLEALSSKLDEMKEGHEDLYAANFDSDEAFGEDSEKGEWSEDELVEAGLYEQVYLN